MCAEPRTLHARSMRTVPGGSPAERPGARALTLRCPSVFDEHLLPHLLDPTRSERSVLLCGSLPRPQCLRELLERPHLHLEPALSSVLPLHAPCGVTCCHACPPTSKDRLRAQVVYRGNDVDISPSSRECQEGWPRFLSPPEIEGISVFCGHVWI